MRVWWTDKRIDGDAESSIVVNAAGVIVMEMNSECALWVAELLGSDGVARELYAAATEAESRRGEIHHDLEQRPGLSFRVTLR